MIAINHRQSQSSLLRLYEFKFMIIMTLAPSEKQHNHIIPCTASTEIKLSLRKIKFNNLACIYSIH